MIFWLLKYWNSSLANFSIISIYWNSSQANFSIISIYWNSSQDNLGFSEIGNALRNLLISARTHILVQINLYTIHYTLNEYALHLTAERVANRYCNNMSMTLFQAYSPLLRYITVNSVHRWQAQSFSYYCKIYSQHASCNAYSFSI